MWPLPLPPEATTAGMYAIATPGLGFGVGLGFLSGAQGREPALRLSDPGSG